MDNILSYYGSIHTTFLHSYSEKGTEFLLQHLNVKKNDVILEFGFGTGGTLVKVKSRNYSVSLFGLDASALMLKKAISRLKFCRLLKNINLQLIASPYKFPFKNDFFDKVYIESVLGIIENEYLEIVLSEIYRTLKPNGKLVFNETIWIPETTKHEIDRINASCKKLYGIQQAQAGYAYVFDWEQLLKKVGFLDVKSMQIRPTSKKNIPNKNELLSKVYTFLGKIKSLNPFLIKYMNRLKKESKGIYEDKKYMEGYLFTALK
ncbi:MAG: methyltransferase domain-containing protein [Bacteroidia bacterium]|nr:methyltransferase domain-containing protein [Bacteroidia bacterium]